MIDPTAKVCANVQIFSKGERYEGAFLSPANQRLIDLEIGPGCRIDAFTVITVGEKGIKIGRNVHVGCFSFISGAHGRVEIGDYCSLSPRSTIYTATDEMAENCLIGACAPEEFRRVIAGDVRMMDGSAVATNGIVFPGVTLGIGSVVGANAMTKRDLIDGEIVIGCGKNVPARIGDIRDYRRIERMIKDASH